MNIQTFQKITQTLKTRLNTLMSDSKQIFVAVVGIPFIITAIYLYIFSPDRYISQSKLSIHDANVAPISTDLFSTLGLSNGQEQNDMRLLQAYLYSPELLNVVDASLNVKKHYSSSLDFLFGINQNSSSESFIGYFHQRMNVQVDGTTGLIAITTEGFDPDFSLALNKLLLSEGERFINVINQNIAEKEMQFSIDEVNRSLTALNKAQAALSGFQAQTNLASPEVEGASIITIVYQMEASLAEAKTQLRETLAYLSNEAPQAKALSSKIEALEAQISETKSKLTGSSTSSINQIGAKYQELLLDAQLAHVVYETALSSFELARTQSTKQLKHLLIASEPALAEDALLPERGYWLSTLALLYLCIYGIFILVARSIAEHRE